MTPALVYTPAADFHGTDGFTYTVSDGVFTTPPATVAITVTPVNDSPIADAGADQVVPAADPSGVDVTLDATGSSDADDDPLTFAWSGPFGSASGPSPVVPLPLGVHLITLTVTDSAGASATDTVAVAVRGFTLAATPTGQSVPPGASTTFAVELTAVAGFDAPVSLSVAGLPSGASATFAPDTAIPTATVFLNVATAATTPQGDFTLTLTAASAPLTQTAPLTLSVTSTPPAGDFALTAAPTAQRVVRGDALVAVEISAVALGDFVDPVSLNVTGLPPGAAASFSPPTMVPTDLGALSVTLSPATPLGLAPLTITGTSGGLTRNVAIELDVLASPVGGDNTPASSEPIAVDVGQGVTTTFSAVTAAGSTTATASTTGPPPPTGFRLAGVYYDLATTAAFVAPVTVCIRYTDSPNEASFRLLHREGNNWIDVTSPGYPDTVANIVCGEATSFSPFAVMVMEAVFDGGGQSRSVDAFLRPVAIVLRPFGRTQSITGRVVDLPAGTTRLDVMFDFGPGARPETLGVSLNRAEVLAPGSLSPAAVGTVLRGLVPASGRNVLLGRMAGTTSNAEDRDRLVFILP